MAENVTWKQKHLLSIIPNDQPPDAETCLFNDACTLTTEERFCVRHQECCDSWSCLDSTQLFDFLWTKD